MLHNIVISQYLPEYSRVLLYDGGVGDHINNSVHAVLHRVLQSKSQRRNGFPTAGGHGQRVDASGPGGFLQTLRQNGTALPIEGRISRKPRRDIGIQPPQQYRQRVITAPLGWVLRHEGFRIQIIRIHQTGIQHPHPHGQEIWVGDGWTVSGPGQSACPVTGGDAACHGFFDSTRTGGHTGIIRFGIAKIRQAAVMPHYAACHGIFAELCAFQSTCGGMVCFGPTVQPLLEGIRTLANVMGKTQKPPPFFLTKLSGKAAAQFGGAR